MKGPEYLHSPTKRKVDYVTASLLLTASSPVFVGMYIENKLREQPLFFRQERLGQNGELFDMIKFETLYTGAEKEPTQLSHIHDPRSSNKEKELTDPRIPNGRMKFMRVSGLNELPQTINVFRGEMSTVGPRSKPLYYINAAEELFPDITEEWKNTALTVRPGLMGVSPLVSRALPVEQFDITAQYDIEYFNNATVMRDFQVIYQALLGLLR